MTSAFGYHYAASMATGPKNSVFVGCRCGELFSSQHEYRSHLRAAEAKTEVNAKRRRETKLMHESAKETVG